MPVYVEIFHGRSDPKEDLEDWGFEGPILGPLPFFHITYGFHCKFDEEFDLHIHGDGLLFFEGGYYGDFSIFGEDQLADEKIKARIKETKEILNSTKKEWMIWATEKETTWKKLFAERRLQGLKIGNSE
jgi:hypothetical protein